MIAFSFSPPVPDTEEGGELPRTGHRSSAAFSRSPEQNLSGRSPKRMTVDRTVMEAMIRRVPAVRATPMARLRCRTTTAAAAATVNHPPPQTARMRTMHHSRRRGRSRKEFNRNSTSSPSRSRSPMFRIEHGMRRRAKAEMRRTTTMMMGTRNSLVLDMQVRMVPLAPLLHVKNPWVLFCSCLDPISPVHGVFTQISIRWKPSPGNKVITSSHRGKA